MNYTGAAPSRNRDDTALVRVHHASSNADRLSGQFTVVQLSAEATRGTRRVVGLCDVGRLVGGEAGQIAAARGGRGALHAREPDLQLKDYSRPGEAFNPIAYRVFGEDAANPTPAPGGHPAQPDRRYPW